MHSIRRSLVLVVIGVAAAALTRAIATVREHAEAAHSFMEAVRAHVLAGLRLFAAPEPMVRKLPEARACLTERQRHDLHASPVIRPTVSPRWRLVPST